VSAHSCSTASEICLGLKNYDTVEGVYDKCRVQKVLDMSTHYSAEMMVSD